MKPQRTIRKGPTADATTDGFTNVVARLGINGTNAISQGTYKQVGLSLNPRLLETMYSTSWICGKVVDQIAEDMTRAGIVIQGTDKVDELHAEFTKTNTWTSLTELIQWGRLYGGAIAVIMIEGQNLASPLRLETVAKGAYKGLTVIDRWRITTDGTTTLAAGIAAGQPEFYTLSATNERVHHTRVIRQIGVALPYWQALLQQGWGASVLERLDDRVIAFDSVTMGAANLVFKAYLRTVRVEGLRQILAGGGKGEENLIKMFRLMQTLQTNEGITLLDKLDEFDTHAYAFAGLPDLITKFGEQLSGASGIPLVILFGQSPSGFNSGDADVRKYNDSINSQQEARLRSPLETLLQVAHRSCSGTNAPDEMAFQFAPLWQMTEKEKADIGKVTTDAVVSLEGSGIISRGTALREMRRSSLVTGMGSTITDEEITEADEEPPMPDVEGLPPSADPAAALEGEQTPTGEPGEVKPTIKKKAADAWGRWFRGKK